MSAEKRANINFAITVILTGVYLFVLTCILSEIIPKHDFKARIAYGIPGCISVIAISAFLAGFTYNKLEKKYNYENWVQYNGEEEL